MRLRVASGLLVFSAFFGGAVLTAEGAPVAAGQPADGPSIVYQQPAATPNAPVSAPRFSTIPPLPNVPTPTSSALPPTRVIPPAPTPFPTRIIPPAPPITVPISVPAPAPAAGASTSAAPRAGGIPPEVTLLALTGSVSALGGGLYLFRRSRKR